MDTLTLLFYLAWFAIAVLALVLAVVVMAYHNLLTRFKNLDQKDQTADQKLAEAEQVLIDAHQQATKKLAATDKLDTQLKSELEKALKSAKSDYVESFESQATQLTVEAKQTLEEAITGFSEAMTTQLQGLMDGVIENIQQETKQQQAEFSKLMAEQRSRQLEAAQKDISEQINQVVVETLGSALTKQQHQQLVEAALSKAEQQGVFDL